MSYHLVQFVYSQKEAHDSTTSMKNWVGGFKDFCNFHPENLVKMNPFWLIFFKGVGSTTSMKKTTAGASYTIPLKRRGFAVGGTEAFRWYRDEWNSWKARFDFLKEGILGNYTPED